MRAGEWGTAWAGRSKGASAGRPLNGGHPDPAQKIFDRRSGLSDLPPSFSLTVNFRNTRAIADVVKKLGRVEMDSHEQCPEGEPPTVHVDERPSKTRRQLEDVVRGLMQKDRLAPDQISILTPHKRENSSLAGMTEVAGVALADDPSEREGKILHTTIGRYKGLESDVILLVDIDATDERCDRPARYVAASRARHVLHVWAKGDWVG